MINKIKNKITYKIPKADKQLTIGRLKDVYNKKSINIIDKKSTRILIIDDEGYDEEPLKQLGYLDIEKEYKFTKMSNYEKYDVIFCDINNVATKFANQGAELAKQIKETYPEKCVVIFTGNLQNISIANKYKDYVDEMIEKNADPSELARIINKHIEKRWNPIVYWENIEKEMRNNKISNKEIGIIEHFYVKSIVNKFNYINDDMYLQNKKEFPTKEIIEFITTIGQMIVAYLTIKGGT